MEKKRLCVIAEQDGREVSRRSFGHTWDDADRLELRSRERRDYPNFILVETGNGVPEDINTPVFFRTNRLSEEWLLHFRAPTTVEITVSATTGSTVIPGSALVAAGFTKQVALSPNTFELRLTTEMTGTIRFFDGKVVIRFLFE